MLLFGPNAIRSFITVNRGMRAILRRSKLAMGSLLGQSLIILQVALAIRGPAYRDPKVRQVQKVLQAQKVRKAPRVQKARKVRLVQRVLRAHRDSRATRA